MCGALKNPIKKAASAERPRPGWDLSQLERSLDEFPVLQPHAMSALGLVIRGFGKVVHVLCISFVCRVPQK